MLQACESLSQFISVRQFVLLNPHFRDVSRQDEGPDWVPFGISNGLQTLTCMVACAAPAASRFQ